MFNWVFSVASIGLTVLLSLSYRQARRRRCALEDADLLREAVDSSEDEEEEEVEIASVVRDQVWGSDAGSGYIIIVSTGAGT